MFDWNYFDVLLWAITGIIIAGCILKIYLRITTVTKCHNLKTMNGKTVIITGANTGIGKETARELARLNGKIILACRSMKRGMEAAYDIIKTTGNSNVVVKLLDLSSIKSVKTFAKEILETEERLDVLINNAGISGLKHHILTEDGLEITFATNYFGHYVLTLLLLDLMKRSAPSRIINVSSRLYQIAKLDFQDLNLSKNYSPFIAYNNSKLANILFTIELSKRLEGSGVTVNSVHPGMVNTEILRNGSGLLSILFKTMFFIFGKNSEDGAQTIIFLAASKDVEGISGKYFVECKDVKLVTGINFESLASKLWDASENIYNNIEKQELN